MGEREWQKQKELQAQREAMLAAAIAERDAGRAKAEAEGTYYPIQNDAVVYIGQPTRASGKDLIEGAESAVTEVTADSVTVRFQSIGHVKCSHADVRKK